MSFCSAHLSDVILQRIPEMAEPPKWLMDVAEAHRAVSELKGKSQSSGSAELAAVQSFQIPLNVPPPSPEASAEPETMEEHALRWLQAKPADVRPEDNTTCVMGRPSELLVVSHHGATPPEYDPYMVYAFYPLRPKYLVGRRGSVCAPNEKELKSGIQWWKVLRLVVLCVG